MPPTIGMLLYPGLTALDLSGPHEILHRVPGADVHLVWKERGPVMAESGMVLHATTTFASCPPLDVLMVPGGPGQAPLMVDEEVLGFLRLQADGAAYVTSVCTGALLLGAAGLLTGYDATTHWAFMDLLPFFGARPVRRRVVVDRNRITGGGVTAGIDFALYLAKEIAGERAARRLQLALEYDPEPPFRGGTPDASDPGLVTEVRAMLMALPLLLGACSGGGSAATLDAGGPGGDGGVADVGLTDDGGADAGPCIDDAAPGDHAYTCEGILYDVAIPAQCGTQGACGLVVDVHGLTMDGRMEDNNTNMRALGAQHGYVVVQPNANPPPPNAQWKPPGDDERIERFLEGAIPALGVNPARVHFTGFSDGGAMTLRFLCAHADMFASVAAGAAASCFQAGAMPSREVPLLYMHGTKDALESFQTEAIPQRDAIVAAWNMGAGSVVAQGSGYVRTRYTSPSGTVFEFLQHDYVAGASLLGGHCYPGSTDPGTEPGQLFPFGCVPPNEFVWGVEAMAFFMAHE